MKTKHSGIALAWLAATLLLTACGGGGGSSTGNGATYSLSGQVQKGPFSIGSQVTVNELDASLNPTGKVYNVQTSDDLGNFAVSSKIGTNLVEIVGDGFYMDELTGQLAASRIQLRAVADLSVNATPTVNILTSLQEQRLKTLLSQGKTYTAANTQSQTEVLAVFGIDSTKINSLATLYSMKINGTTDADSVLLATSVILSKMATNAAVTNGTTQPAELSSYISTIAAQIASAGTITDAAITSAKNLAATQIDLVAVRTNVETYYANKGVTIVAPKFEEWVDKSGSGILPQRLVPVTGLTFTDVTGASPAQLITSNVITVAGLGAGIVAPVTVNIGTTIIKNNVAVTGTNSTAQDGDTISLRITSQGYGLTNSANISVGSSSAIWLVTTKPLGGTISGLTSTGLVLQNNAGDNITIAANSTNFSFPVTVANGASYSVSVLTQPASPIQNCSVTNGSGTAGTAPSSITVACSAVSGFAYVTNQNSNTVSAYTIDGTTGALTSIGTFGTGTNPRFVTVDPTGKFVYVVNSYSDCNVSAFSINSLTGLLTSVGTYVGSVSYLPGGTVSQTYPESVTVDPSGKFAYVTNYSSSNVDAFTINSTTGALTFIGAIATGSGPHSVAVDPTGKFAYVAYGVNVSGGVSAFTINTTTGALTGNGTIAAGVWATGISIDPTGQFAYAVSSTSIFAYTINGTTGALTSNGTYVAGANLSDFTIDPTGKFAYVTDQNSSTVSAYTINGTTGALTSAGSLGTGAANRLIRVEPTGKFSYIVNFSDSYINGYSINGTTGALSSIGTFANNGMSQSSIAIRPFP